MEKNGESLHENYFEYIAVDIPTHINTLHSSCLQLHNNFEINHFRFAIILTFCTIFDSTPRTNLKHLVYHNHVWDKNYPAGHKPVMS